MPVILKQLRRYIGVEGRRRLWGLLGLVILSIIGALFEVAGLSLIVPLIALVQDPGKISDFPFLYVVVDAVGGKHSHLIALMATVLCAVFLVKNVYMAFLARVQSYAVNFWRRDLCQRLMDHYLRAPYEFHVVRNSAELVRNVVFVTETFFTHFLTGIVQTTVHAILVCGILLFLIAQDPKTMGVSILVLSVLFFLQRKFFRKKLRHLGEEFTQVVRDRQQFLQQVFGSVKEMKVLGRERGFMDLSDRVHTQYATNAAGFGFFNQLPSYVQEASVMIGFLVVVIVLALTEPDPKAYLPTLGLLAGGAFRLVPALNKVMGGLNLINRGEHTGQILFDEIEDLERQRRDRFEKAAAPKGKEISFTSAITLENITYTYPGASQPALSNISLTIRRGQLVGLAGPSGAGKSTLADVILGLYKPQQGRTLVDGVDVDLQQAWAGRISYVPQTIYILDDTLRRNVALGLRDEEIEEDRILEALRLAHLQDLVQSLPRGLDTVLGEHGVRLSGGQRQRVGIARALYSDPDILVFDEATSALDVQTEGEITAAVNGLRGSKTMIVIAHRLSTLRDCDRIVMLHQGRVAGEGEFAVLAQSNDAFRKMVALSQTNHPGFAEG